MLYILFVKNEIHQIGQDLANIINIARNPFGLHLYKNFIQTWTKFELRMNQTSFLRR